MDLKELVGTHNLTAVDFGVDPADAAANNCTFVLDGIAYRVTENPDDGYRSYMRDIVVVDGWVPQNSFAPCSVHARYIEKERDYEDCEILQMDDATTGRPVLRVGEGNSDDYYPYYIADFDPRNMAVNATAESTEQS